MLAGGLYWEEHGPVNAPVLLLSAGLGGSASYWAPNLTALSARYRVLLYDHRGTGRSERMIDGMLTVERMADDMRIVMAAAGAERVTVIGHAAGGLAGLALALAAPDRVERLVVINGWARLDPHTARCFDTRLVLLRNGARPYLHAQPLFLYPPQWISENHDRLQAEEEELIAHFPDVEMVQRRIAAVRHFNIMDRMGAVRAPTLLLASDDDMLVPPPCSEVLANGIPDAQLARMTHGGHACNVTRPDNFNRWLLAWLDDE